MEDINQRLARLNPQQREAVTAPDGPLLVTAGAGSGKTAVLVNRIAWLIGVRRVPAHRIIAVTFTNKAAREMKGRVQDLLQGERINPQLGTFHGLCNQFLRVRHEEAGLDRRFGIMDQDDQKTMIASLMKSKGLNLKEYTPRSVQNYINQRKDAKKRAGESETFSYKDDLSERIYELYEQACEEQGLVDFAELILRTVEVMERNAEVREHIQDRYLHVLIDEFQDTNELQFQWMELFGGKHQNICAVGDEDQSIYSWRGALAGNLKRFERNYRDALVIRLEQNYRSTKHILDAANALIRHNSDRYEKKLWTGRSGGNRIKYLSAGDSIDEARFVADQIAHLTSSGRSYSEFAVLYRTNAQSRNFEEMLGAQGIPFRVYGGVRFYSRKEVKDAVSYLRLISNSNANDALLRAINSPPRGVGDVTKKAIAEHAGEQKVSYWEAACELVNRGGRWARMAPFVKLINQLRELNETHSLRELTGATIELSGLRAHYEKQADSAEERDRIVNLDELITAAADYERIYGSGISAEALGDYLDTVALDPGDTHDDEPQERVQMMTLHSAKGLEFPVVFLTGLDETVLPHFFSMEASWQSFGKNKKEKQALEEERRLCYVGITRAEEQLFITRANRRMVRGEWWDFRRSRFLKEIPPQLIEPVYSSPALNPFEPDDIGLELDDECYDWLGKSVTHRKFGFGVVTEAEPNGDNPYLTVEFETYGTKMVLSEYVTPEA